jgi:6-pyruvoyltetrahydropterin/6-carboxytetrahydropterin synthase
MRITRRLEFDAGHRIPDHRSQCRHLHGHRYALEITLSGEIIESQGDPANGMVMDFGDIKTIAMREIVDKWDHAFLVYEKDTEIVLLLEKIPDHKTVLLDVVPTAENLATAAFRILAPKYTHAYGNNLKLERVRLYETPNCWADATDPIDFVEPKP